MGTIGVGALGVAVKRPDASDRSTVALSSVGAPMPQIRKHAQRIYTLAGGVQASPKKKRKKRSKGQKA